MQPASRLLSEVKITSFSSLTDAVTTLHRKYSIPHIVVTSVRFEVESATLSVVGSTVSANGSPRLFKVDVPAIDCFFSGTGDMFAALTVVRLREAVTEAKLSETTSWVSPDEVEAVSLPLAKATENVLASMQAVLEKTKAARDEVLRQSEGSITDPEDADSEKKRYLIKTKAAEVKLVRNMQDLREPKVQYQAQPLDL